MDSNNHRYGTLSPQARQQEGLVRVIYQKLDCSAQRSAFCFKLADNKSRLSPKLSGHSRNSRGVMVQFVKAALSGARGRGKARQERDRDAQLPTGFTCGHHKLQLSPAFFFCDPSN